MKYLYNGEYKEIKIKADIPTKVSDLTNDSGYQTAAQVAAAIEETQEDFIKSHEESLCAIDSIKIVESFPSDDDNEEEDGVLYIKAGPFGAL